MEFSLEFSMKLFMHRNKYMERKFHREKKTIELIETLVECIEFWSKLCANGKFFYCGISLPYIYFYVFMELEISYKGMFLYYVMRLGGVVFGLMTEPYTAKGICRVLHYEGEGGGQKYLNTALRNTRTFPKISVRGTNLTNTKLQKFHIITRIHIKSQ